MSENIPSRSPRKRRKRRYEEKLPTPPPDPTAPQKTEDFLAYLDSLQKTNPIIAAEDAFDHLEKLYKLMEQMLELREQNAKLHRRVQDLERINNLEKMHQQLDVEVECPELDKDTAFAETILESILSEKKPKWKTRSGSVTLNRPGVEVGRRASADAPAKVSKWTKVKAVLKWEKASVSDAKSQDSGIGGGEDGGRFLRVPSTVEDHGHSPVDSGAAEVSTPGTLSTASSTEDFHRHDQRSPCDDLKSSDDEHSQNYIPHSKDGSQKLKCHKTPWAKMKDIIQTRNSFKKKHRLSGLSDDIQIDVEVCSDNEEVFEEDEKKSPRTYKRALSSNDVPPEVVARYQQAIAEDSSDSRKTSRWTRVKKAFLPPPEAHRKSPTEHEAIQDEILKNYEQLQKKISQEFLEKLNEWDRTKQTSPGTPIPSSSTADDSKDPSFMKKMEEWQKIKSQPPVKSRPSIQLKSEEHLPPEFRKKLQEWEKIRKNSNKDSKKKLSEMPRWKSLSGPKSESPAIEYPQITEDFKRKLEEWKQIKAGGNEENEGKKIKSSPRLSRKGSSTKRKKTPDKELQWYEKELGKIEKEKQRLERERQRFLEREESLAKLRSSVVGGLKKEVLIHTPSGFYRFEGISRKFTQKLYEWEKAQGIGPESSTFALLSSSLNQNTKTSSERKSSGNTSSLVRSKSADSIAVSALNLACPLMSQQPSSLSLNDVDELEKECLADSKSSSMQFINNSHETFQADEPEALIVEVEDIVEETAAPLHTYAQRTQQPVYRRQELKAICEGETCAAPKVRRSESTRAQNNYNLIEEIFSLLKNLTENELEIQKTQDTMAEQEKKSNSDIIKLKMFDESQKMMANRLSEKLLRLQEANSNIFSNLTREDSSEFNNKHVVETLETVQDLSSEIFQLTEKLEVELVNRNVYDIFKQTGARSLNPITEIAKEIRNKMLELRRRLSYICAATDLTAPRRRPSSIKKSIVKKTLSNESNDENISRTGSDKMMKEGRLFVKSETSNAQSQGAIKKRIRHRQKCQQKTSPDTDEEEDADQKRNTHKKLTRTRSVSESSTKTENLNKKEEANLKKKEEEEIVVDESILQKVVVPTQTTILNMPPVDNTSVDSPVTLFVKTTRKLFTPIVESKLCEKLPAASEEKQEETNKENSSSTITPVVHLPPLPASPTPQRKAKDISPSIRLMLAKYNQKVSEQETPSSTRRSSSGSVSPLPWRSPSSERRVKAQTERYQQELRKFEVQKSASVGVLQRENFPVKKNVVDNTAILKSSSISAISTKRLEMAKEEEKKSTHSPEIRLKKLQKAKEEFLNSSPSPVVEEPLKFPARNRLSQISMDSESSYESCAGALIKSASAGMINVDADVYKQFEVHGGGYVSLPRSTKKQKQGFLGGKFAFSSIASKFRKVKMRRGKDKDPNKMSTVSTLCRQSLVVDIQQQLNSGERQDEEKEGNAISGDVSPTTSRTGSWMRKTKLFKK